MGLQYYLFDTNHLMERMFRGYLFLGCLNCLNCLTNLGGTSLFLPELPELPEQCFLIGQAIQAVQAA